MAQAAREKARVDAEVTAAARSALIVSLVGLIVCCIPVIPIAAIVMGARARGLAKQHGVRTPSNATTAIALGVTSILLFGAFVAWSIVQDQQKEERIAKLEASIEEDVDDKKLDVETACTLVEIHLLQEGYKGTSAVNIDGVSCPGKLTQKGEKAELDDVRIKSSKPETAIACFKRGNKWYVERIDATPCEAAEAGSSASPSAAPSAPTPEP